MLEEEKKFIKLELRDIDLGKPLRWSIYNGDREEIYRRGDIFKTQAEVEAAFVKGAYRIVTLVDISEGNPGLVLDVRRPVPAAAPAPAAASAEAGAERPKAGAKKSEHTLESSKIRIGDSIQLQASPDQPRYVVRLIGYLKNRGLIVTQPEINGEVIMLRDGQHFVGRFFSGQAAFAFSTVVVRQTSVPFAHMHLTYPRDVRGVSVRSSSRLDVSIIASIEAAGGVSMPGKIVNLSIAGAGFRTKLEVGHKGDHVVLKFKVSMLGIDTLMALNAEICNVSRTEEEPATPHLYGVKFKDADQASQLSLAAFVYYQLQEEAAR